MDFAGEAKAGAQCSEHEGTFDHGQALAHARAGSYVERQIGTFGDGFSSVCGFPLGMNVVLLSASLSALYPGCLNC